MGGGNASSSEGGDSGRGGGGEFGSSAGIPIRECARQYRKKLDIMLALVLLLSVEHPIHTSTPHSHTSKQPPAQSPASVEA